jgi:hypothetical protein
MAKFWQHETPLTCPKGHRMYWLGSVYWICPKEHCGTIYVQTVEPD